MHSFGTTLLCGGPMFVPVRGGRMLLVEESPFTHDEVHRRLFLTVFLIHHDGDSHSIRN